jgi:hypothetical protein
MSEEFQDLFISHASVDKPRYIKPLADCLTKRKVTFWLDSLRIAWGDSVPLKINEGLRESRYVLLCLSAAFLKKPWPEAELAAGLSVQNASGQKRVLPLILNERELVLQTYPLLASLAYREYAAGPDALADEIAGLTRSKASEPEPGHIKIEVESVHTGKLCNIVVSPRVSLKWLSDRARSGLDLSDRAETGAFVPFMVRWVLVDKKVEAAWLKLPRSRMRKLIAVVATAEGPLFCETDTDRLNDVGVVDGTVFHLYAIEDERALPPLAMGPPSGPQDNIF